MKTDYGHVASQSVAHMLEIYKITPSCPTPCRGIFFVLFRTLIYILKLLRERVLKYRTSNERRRYASCVLFLIDHSIFR